MSQRTSLQRLAIALSQIQEQQILLSSEQIHYLGRVLRLQSGDRFIAMDGRGQWWLAAFQGAEAPAQLLEPIPIQTELPIGITLLAAPPKGSGFDEVVRQATELGVSQIVPILSDRTLLNPSPQKQERWQRIAQEAAEQSLRQVIPQLSPPLTFVEVLQSCTSEQRYICVPEAEVHLLNIVLPTAEGSIAMAAGRSLAIATGPEGGWTAAEVEQAVQAGFQPVTLGRRILRAVTAPVVALSLVAARLESASGLGLEQQPEPQQGEKRG